jgi:uncharacterized membrane-anchored protein
MSHNDLSSEALFKLITWMLAMGCEELQDRPTPLEIDLQGNKVSMEFILRFVFIN